MPSMSPPNLGSHGVVIVFYCVRVISYTTGNIAARKTFRACYTVHVSARIILVDFSARIILVEIVVGLLATLI